MGWAGRDTDGEGGSPVSCTGWGGLGLRGGAEWGETECVVVAGGERGGRGGGEGRPGFSGKIDEPGGEAAERALSWGGSGRGSG